MTEPKGVPHRRLLTAVCVLLSAHFAIAYNDLTTPMVAFGVFRNFSGRGPFAYRVLPGLLWRGVGFLLQPVHRSFPGVHLPHMNRPFATEEDWFLVMLSFLSMLGTLLVARRLLRRIDPHWGVEWMALGMGYAAYFDTVLVLNRNLFYPYDLPALFFFTLLVYLAYRGRPVGFALALIPAMLNKETAVMAVVVYFGLQYGRRPMRILAPMCAGMCGVAVSIRLVQLAVLLRVSPERQEMTQNQLGENLHQLHNPLFWLSASAVFGFAYVAVIVLWRFVPMRIRVTTIAVFSLWLVVMTVTGVLREVRIFSELSGLILLAVGLGVHGWIEERRRAAALV